MSDHAATDDDETASAPASLLDRLPALRRIGELVARDRVPVVQQLTATECGAACLAMVLGYYGRHTPIDALRAEMGVGRDGASAATVIRAATAHGLRARGVKLDLDELEFLDCGSVLHWNFDHFVVFERLVRGGAQIVDPALGRRRVPMRELSRAFTGVAVLFEPGDDFARRRDASGRRLARYLLGAMGDARLWARIVTASLLIQLFGLAGPALTGTVVDRVVPREDTHLLAVVGAGLAALVALQAAATLVRAQLLLRLRTQLEMKITAGFMEHLVALPMAFFQQRSAGDLLLRMGSVATVRELLTTGALSTMLDGLLVVVYLGALLAADRGMALLVVCVAAAQAALLAATQRRQRELMSQHLAAQTLQNAQQVEMLTGIETLKAGGAEARLLEQWSERFVDSLNVSLARGALAAWTETLLGALRVGAPLLIVGYGAHRVLAHEMTLGAMLALAGVATGFLTPLNSLTLSFGQFQVLGSYLRRIQDVLDAAPEQPADAAGRRHTVRGELALESVTFRYSAAAPPVLRDVSVRIRPGAFVAIVGRSGSGKSTLGSVLLGLYPPAAGRVLVDGVDLRELDLRHVRQQLGVVSQRPHLFNTSVRRNIALALPDAPLEAVQEAARRARIDEDIAKMPLGYDTPIGDGGASLSGGQRQRIALARALLHRPRVVLLDEATSALDEATEREVQRELARLDCTRVVIAHRLSTVRDADVILVVDEGAIVEQGTHAELLARGGAYARLVGQQASGTERGCAPSVAAHPA